MDGFERFSSSLFGVARGWNKLATSVMKEYDLKGVYAFYLFALNEYDGSLTSADLANVCGRDKADVSRAVTTLEARGLLKREGNSSNAPSSSSTIPYTYSVASKVSRRFPLAEYQPAPSVTQTKMNPSMSADSCASNL